MTNFIERVVRIFGDGTPGHKIKLAIQKNNIEIHVEQLPLTNPVSVKYKVGTEIKIFPEKDYRPFGEEEVILAKDIQFFGEGMSNGFTTDGRYFKAMDDPIEINPLEIVNNESIKKGSK